MCCQQVSRVINRFSLGKEFRVVAPAVWWRRWSSLPLWSGRAWKDPTWPVIGIKVTFTNFTFSIGELTSSVVPSPPSLETGGMKWRGEKNGAVLLGLKCWVCLKKPARVLYRMLRMRPRCALHLLEWTPVRERHRVTFLHDTYTMFSIGLSCSKSIRILCFFIQLLRATTGLVLTARGAINGG